MNLGDIDVSVEVINCYNNIILGQGGHSGEDNACWGQRIYGNQILGVLLCCEPKTALKNSLLIKRKKKETLLMKFWCCIQEKYPVIWKTINIFLPFLIIFLCEARLSSNSSTKITNTVTEWKSR